MKDYEDETSALYGRPFLPSRPVARKVHLNLKQTQILGPPSYSLTDTIWRWRGKSGAGRGEAMQVMNMSWTPSFRPGPGVRDLAETT